MSFRTPETSLSSSRISAIRRTCGTRSQTRAKVQAEFFDEDSFSFDQSHIPTTEESIRRFLDIGDFDSAVYWIDHAYAKETEGDTTTDPVKFAHYLKMLTSAQQWLRVSSMLESSDKFYTRHILFAYFYVKSLFQRKMYGQVADCQIGHLIDVEDTPIKAPILINGVDASLCGTEAPIFNEQMNQLNQISNNLSIHSAILLVLGQTFIFLENREAAAKFLRGAIKKDSFCLKAENLLLQYKLLESKEETQVQNMACRRNPTQSRKDPRSLTNQAKALYARGDPKGAIRITNEILRLYGWYMDCIVTHINSLVMIEDSDGLFTFAHHMVDAMSDNECSWYAVALYYYSCKNTIHAKSFMNKATMMNQGFGDGWLALGHILASDSDNDQALSCYYRAARIMERNFEPSLYIAMQYCKSGVKLSKQFLNDADRLAPNNPIVLQEQGCLAYSEKDFLVAVNFFEKALLLVLAGEDLTILKQFEKREAHEHLASRNHPIDTFWTPLLNNLGHCCRRLGWFEKSKIYHQNALLLQSKNAQALCSSAMSLVMLGEHHTGVQQLNKALSIQPFDQNIREAMDHVMRITCSFTAPVTTDYELITTANELEKMSTTPKMFYKKVFNPYHGVTCSRFTLDETRLKQQGAFDSD